MTPNSETVKKRYNRIAPFFDVMEGLMEVIFFRSWRELMWQKIEGKDILEVGVGTGKNLSFYPDDSSITAIDLSDKMLFFAKQKADKQQIDVDLKLMDVQELDFADNSFDTAIATFVFCSVPYPDQGLKEIYRVLKPGGKILLLEHILSSRPFIAWVMNLLNPLVAVLFGANINRKTVETVENSGFKNVKTDNKISGDIVKLIEAKKPD